MRILLKCALLSIGFQLIAGNSQAQWQTDSTAEMGEILKIVRFENSRSIYAFELSGTIYESHDSARSWQLLACLQTRITSTGVTFKAEPDGYLYVSDTMLVRVDPESGETETVVTNSDIGIYTDVSWDDFAVLPSGDISLLVSSKGLLVSTDGGVSWHIKNMPDQIGHRSRVSLRATANEYLYIRDAQIFRSQGVKGVWESVLDTVYHRSHHILSTDYYIHGDTLIDIAYLEGIMSYNLKTRSGRWLYKVPEYTSVKLYSFHTDGKGHTSVLVFGEKDETVQILKVSYDYGYSWRKIQYGDHYVGRDVHVVVYDSTRLVKHDRAGTELLATTDNGMNWELLYDNMYRMRCAVLSHRGNWYIGSNGRYAYSKKKGEKSWTSLKQPPWQKTINIVNRNGIALQGKSGYDRSILYSIDGFRSVEGLFRLTFNSMVITDNDWLIAALPIGVYESKDYFQTRNRIYDQELQKLCISAGRYVFGCNTTGMAWCYDLALEQGHVLSCPEVGDEVVGLVTDGEMNYVIITENKILRSSDGGAVWKRDSIDAGVRNHRIYQKDDGEIFVLSEDGFVYSSNDMAGSWKAYDMDGVESKVTDLVVDDEHIYIATRRQGLLKRENPSTTDIESPAPVVKQEIRVHYPEPSSNVLTVLMPEAKQSSSSYSIYNILGQKIVGGTVHARSTNSFSIPVNGLNNGLYVLLMNGKQIKFTVQR